MTDWNALAERCLLAPKSHDSSDDELKAISGEICLALMPRDDYPSIATRIDGAVRLGNVGAAIELVEQLYPGWGYQVGRPLTVRSPCGWYASVFRERRPDDKYHPFSGSYGHDIREGEAGYRAMRYANDPALALIAAFCRLMAVEQPGTTALAA